MTPCLTPKAVPNPQAVMGGPDRRFGTAHPRPPQQQEKSQGHQRNPSAGRHTHARASRLLGDRLGAADQLTVEGFAQGVRLGQFGTSVFSGLVESRVPSPRCDGRAAAGPTLRRPGCRGAHLRLRLCRVTLGPRACDAGKISGGRGSASAKMGLRPISPSHPYLRINATEACRRAAKIEPTKGPPHENRRRTPDRH
jgi:hypothetical protein